MGERDDKKSEQEYSEENQSPRVPLGLLAVAHPLGAVFGQRLPRARSDVLGQIHDSVAVLSQFVEQPGLFRREFRTGRKQCDVDIRRQRRKRLDTQSSILGQVPQFLLIIHDLSLEVVQRPWIFLKSRDQPVDVGAVFRQKHLDRVEFTHIRCGNSYHILDIRPNFLDDPAISDDVRRIQIDDEILFFPPSLKHLDRQGFPQLGDFCVSARNLFEFSRQPIHVRKGQKRRPQ